MLYFVLGVSLTINILLIIIGFKFYKKFVPIFRSYTNFDISSLDIDDDWRL